MEKLRLSIDVRRDNGDKYVNSNYKEINPFRQEILHTNLDRVKKAIIKIYEDYNAISKDSSIINIRAYDADSLQDRLIYSYEGDTNKFKIH